MSIKQQQTPFAWGISSILGNQHELTSRYDESSVNQLVESLGMEILQKNVTRTPTTNATIEWGKEDFVIVPEKQGDTIDVVAVQKALIQNLENGKSLVNAEDYYAQPILTKDDKNLKDLKSKMNQLAKLNISYEINGKKVSIPKEELRSWLTTNENAEILLNQENVIAFVTKLNAEYNTKENPTPFNSTRRGEVSVPVGIYSWSIDIPAEAAALSEQILKGKKFQPNTDC